MKTFKSILEELGVGSGQIDGIGVGPKGEPGVRKKQMDKYKNANRKAAISRFKERWSKH